MEPGADTVAVCLGLPDRVTACLSTSTACSPRPRSCTPRPGPETFDDFLRERADGTGEPFVPFDSGAGLQPLRRRPAARRRGAHVPRLPRHHAARGHARTTRRDAETVNGLGNRKNELLLRRDPRRRASRSTRARCATWRRPGPPGCAGRSSRPAPTPARCSRRPASTDLLEVRVDGLVARERGAARQAAPGHVPRRGASCSASPPAQAAVFEDALAGVAAGRAGGFGYVVGVDRVGPGRRAARARRRRRGHATWPSCSTRAMPGADRDRGRVSRSSRGTSGRPGSTWTCWPSPSRCSRSSNGHIGLRGNLDEGEPHGLPGTYLNSFYELRPLPYAEAGYGFPESGQTIVNVTNGKLIRLLVDDEPFDVRYGELLAHERVLDLRAGTLHRERASGARRPASAVRVRIDPAGLVHPARRSPRSATRSSRSTARPRLIVQSELVANEAAAAAEQATRGSPRCWSTPLQAEEHLATRRRRPAGAPHQGQRPADGRRRWTTRSTAPGRHRRRAPRRTEDWAADHGRLRAAARRAAAGGQVPRVRLVQPAVPAGAARPGRAPRWPAPGSTGWDGLLAEQRRLPRRVLGRRRRARSRATRRCSRRSGSGCSTCCRPAPGPSSGRSRRRA